MSEPIRIELPEIRERNATEEILSHIPDGSHAGGLVHKYTRTNSIYTPTRWERFLDRWFT